MKFGRWVVHTVLILSTGFSVPSAVFADAAADAKKADEAKKSEDEKKKAEEAKKKAVEAEVKKRLAEEKKTADAKKKAADAESKKKLDEEKKKKAEEERVRLDDPKNWRARDFTALMTQPLFLYIKDANAKKNTEAALIEGSEFLGDAEFRKKLRGFSRVKIKNDGSDSKGWPAEWLKRAENGAALVLVSADRRETTFVDGGQAKAMLNKEALNTVLDAMLKKETDRKTALAAANKAKAEAKAPKPEMPVVKPEIPGLDDVAAKKAEKPKSKEPVDE